MPWMHASCATLACLAQDRMSTHQKDVAQYLCNAVWCIFKHALPLSGATCTGMDCDRIPVHFRAQAFTLSATHLHDCTVPYLMIAQILSVTK